MDMVMVMDNHEHAHGHHKHGHKHSAAHGHGHKHAHAHAHKKQHHTKVMAAAEQNAFLQESQGSSESEDNSEQRAFDALDIAAGSVEQEHVSVEDQQERLQRELNTPSDALE